MQIGLRLDAVGSRGQSVQVSIPRIVIARKWKWARFAGGWGRPWRSKRGCPLAQSAVDFHRVSPFLEKRKGPGIPEPLLTVRPAGRMETYSWSWTGAILRAFSSRAVGAASSSELTASQSSLIWLEEVASHTVSRRVSSSRLRASTWLPTSD